MLRNQSRNNCGKRKERTRKEKDIQEEEEEEEEEEEMHAVRGSTWVVEKAGALGWAGLTWFFINVGGASGGNPCLAPIGVEPSYSDSASLV